MDSDFIDRWVRLKIDGSLPRDQINWEVAWLFEILERAVSWGYMEANPLRERPAEIPDDYRGLVAEVFTDDAGLDRLHRLGPMQRARRIRAYIKNQRISAREAADDLGFSQSAIIKSMALLKMPRWLQTEVEFRRIPASTALEIMKHPDEEQRVRLGLEVSRGRYRREDVAREVQAFLRIGAEAGAGTPAPPVPAVPKNPVELRGKGLPIRVAGVLRPPIADGAYNAVAALARVWPRRLGLQSLQQRAKDGGGGSTARYHLRKLVKSEQTPWWRTVIDFGGGPYKGYGLVWPQPQLQADLPKLTEVDRVPEPSEGEMERLSVVG